VPAFFFFQRGIGEGAVGTSLSLISPAEDKSHSMIVESLQAKFSKVLLDGRLMTAAQERTNLASKIFVAGEMDQKANSSNRWFLEAAKEADLELDDDLVEDDSNRSGKDELMLKEARKAKTQLEQLLSEPMRTQRFGKFLSTNSSAMQAEIKPLKSKALTTKSSKKKKKKKKKKNAISSS
jgi:ATP-dependent RNA helicase DDX24/MAK5